MDQQLNLLLTLRLRQLHANNLKGISVDDLYRMLVEYRWRKKRPTRISDVANDIFSLRDEDIVRWLVSESKMKGFGSDLSDYEYLFYGDDE